MILYHYCSVEKFFKIIESKCLWLTNLKFTNDCSEIKYGRRIFYDYYQMKTRKSVPDEFRILLQINHPGAYAFCLSDKANLLSQWRAYADYAKGVSIGFDMGSLGILKQYPYNSTIRDHSIGYEKVIYNKQYIFNYLDKIGYFKETNNYLHHLFTLYGNIIPFIKNESFIEESEWRIVYRDALYNFSNDEFPDQNNECKHLGEKKYFTRSCDIIPYFELDFSYNLQLLPIKQIMLAPCCDISFNVIKDKLVDANFKDIDKITLSKSGITYRNI